MSCERTGDLRGDCWCRLNRKPCTYHEGYEDGYEQAERDAGTMLLCDICDHFHADGTPHWSRQS